ncbi:unnamed protein product, partial [Phaeothamnion confervicola]
GGGAVVRAAESPAGGYFGVVWDCAVALGAFLAARRATTVTGRRVLELGAGTGLLSALCRALGAVETVATETEEMVPWLRRNMAINETSSTLFHFRHQVQVRALDWSADVPADLLDPAFDLVLCSDLLYDPAGWVALQATLAALTVSAVERTDSNGRCDGSGGGG